MGSSISATVQPPTLHEVGGGGWVMPVLTLLDQWGAGTFPSCTAHQIYNFLHSGGILRNFTFFTSVFIRPVDDIFAFELCVSVKISGGISPPPQILSGGSNPPPLPG